MKTKESIEIPFGAKDSELKGWEYTIPEGMEAEIKDGKIIVREKESEDERIIRTLKEIVNWGCAKNISVEHNVELKDCLAWLEKQGGQNIIIPKFRVGDTIRWKKADSAKYIIKEINDKGYMNTANGIMDIFQTDKEFELVEQNPAWSEEDIKTIERIVCILDGMRYYNTVDNKQEKPYQSEIIFLNSFKERYTWKPSDEQIKALHDINLTGNISYAGQGQKLIELYRDLKKLKG